MLKKWAKPSGDRGDEIDAKTLYPDRFQYSQLALCPAALLPELQPAPCFLSAIIGQID